MHNNISVFIPHIGCPHKCTFCDQRTISGAVHAPTADEAGDIIRGAYEYMSPEKRRVTEIAFFGGSFTAVPREYMLSLLAAAKKYLSPAREDGFYGIRLSTRPDCINEEILDILKENGVTAIELGSQSMSDRVLALNERGHTAEDTIKSAALIKSYGFELGLQMMVGLYGSSPDDELFTMKMIAGCAPATVRIYPTAVIEGTKLAELYRSGEYKLFGFDECVRLCTEMTKYFQKRGIRIIRMGLHAEKSLEEKYIAGFYHPAFAEIVRSELFRQCIAAHIGEGTDIYVSPRDISAALGHKRSNAAFFADCGISISPDETLKRGTVRMGENIYSIA